MGGSATPDRGGRHEGCKQKAWRSTAAGLADRWGGAGGSAAAGGHGPGEQESGRHQEKEAARRHFRSAAMTWAGKGAGGGQGVDASGADCRVAREDGGGAEGC